jgi:hypothetical protein
MSQPGRYCVYYSLCLSVWNKIPPAAKVSYSWTCSSFYTVPRFTIVLHRVNFKVTSTSSTIATTTISFHEQEKLASFLRVRILSSTCLGLLFTLFLSKYALMIALVKATTEKGKKSDQTIGDRTRVGRLALVLHFLK